MDPDNASPVITTRAKPRFPDRDLLPIEAHGNTQFVQDVERVLEEAQQFCRRAYQDALAYLPKAEWNPHDPRFAGTNYAAWADGVFRYDTRTYPRGYTGFRHGFWHEVGHNVDADCSGTDAGQARADAYADDVVARITAAATRHDEQPILPRLSPTPVFSADPTSAMALVGRIYGYVPALNDAELFRLGAGGYR